MMLTFFVKWGASMGCRRPNKPHPSTAPPTQPYCRISMFIIQQGGSRFNWDHTPVGKVGAACVFRAGWLELDTKVSRRTAD